MPDFRQVMAARLCDVLKPRHIILAGARDRLLADAVASCAGDSILHLASATRREWHGKLRQHTGDRCVIHHAPPEQAIGLLQVPGICWVDADPNWYTTGIILRAIAAQAARLDKPFPVTIVENAGWPYGRRDSYDDPAAIPPEMRRPHERAGLAPGQAAPIGAGPYADRYNAIMENEPENGVLTAIEDFLTGRTDQLRYVLLPGLGGRAAIYPRAAPATEAFSDAAIAAYALAAATELERIRLEQAAALQEREAAVQRAEGLLATLRAVQAPPAPVRAGVRGLMPPVARIARRILRVPRRAAPPDDARDIASLRASAAFDAAWYLQTYRDVAEAGLDPAAHYLRQGAAELRDPGPYFSTGFYLSSYPDVAEAGLNPLLHYLASGAAENREPRPGFDTDSYRQTHPGLADQGLTPLEHAVSTGALE